MEHLTGESEKASLLTHYSGPDSLITLTKRGDWIPPLGSFATGDLRGMGLLMNRLGVSRPLKSGSGVLGA